MTAAEIDRRSPIERLLSRVVHIERGELPALLVSFAFFFLVLSAYYVVRPVRDSVGVTLGRGSLEGLFTIVFLVMLAAVPAYGWLVSNVSRRLVVPAVYLFFIADLMIFWGLFSAGISDRSVASTFFIWVSVFNLFVVSLFWITMSDLWENAQAKRLYGFIAAGGSAGALAGPLLTQGLVGLLGAHALLLVSAVLLAGAMLASMALRQLLGSATRSPRDDDLPAGKDILAGAVEVWRSPFLFRIALWVLLANLVSTFFYLEQSRIVGETIADRTDQVRLFARIDLAVSIMTILAQVFVTGRILEKIGVGAAASAVPVWATLGLMALTISPTLPVVVGVLAIDRAILFAFSSPAIKVLYTVVRREQKYKAQSFIDTVVYRGGDAASGWMISGLSKGLGFSGPAISAITVPLGLVWLALSYTLGKQQADLAARHERETT